MPTPAHNSLPSPGRNDPCPCGSGKKYKKCCLNQDDIQTMADFEWRKLRQTEGDVIDTHLMPYVKKSYPSDMPKKAWDDFLLGNDDFTEEMKQLLGENMFLPWLLFNWVPDYPHVLPKLIAQQYIETRGRYNLVPYQKRFVEAMCQSFYSFYVILEVVHNQSLLLKDIFLQTEHRVKERLGTHTLERGDIIFTRLVSLDGQTISVGMAPFAINPRHHFDLLELRESFRTDNQEATLTPEFLKSQEDRLREEMFFFMDLHFNPPLPNFCNTDGDPLQNHTIKFDVTLPPEEVLHKLMPLTLSKDPEEFLKEAKHTRKKEIKKIEFSWLRRGNKRHKGWENTILGELTLSLTPENTLLTAKVNSTKRAEKIHKLIKKYLKEEATYKSTRVESLIEMLMKANRSKTKAQEENDAFNALPEVQASLADISKEHWKNWLDEDIPFLKDQTPREAVLTLEGRERVEALLLDFERRAQDDHMAMSPDITYLRRELGL